MMKAARIDGIFWCMHTPVLHWLVADELEVMHALLNQDAGSIELRRIATWGVLEHGWQNPWQKMTMKANVPTITCLCAGAPLNILSWAMLGFLVVSNGMGMRT